MTPTQREAALRLIAEFDAQKALRTAYAWPYDVVDLLRELAAEPQGEPAGWINADGDFEHSHKPWMSDAWSPLYAHPPQQRKPLSDEQIYAAISDQVFWATSKNFIVRVVRDVEAAHGITGGKE